MRAYLIDDQGEGHGVRLAERLSRNGFDCVYKPPPTWGQVEGLVADPPDLFLIDYDLSMVPPGGELANYRGTTLVAELKARLPDRPVVLVTRPQIIEGSIHRGTRRQLLQLLRPSDDIIFKHEIDESLDRVLHILRELVKGFRTLAGYERRTWQELINAVAATGEEAAELREASPPLERGKWVVGSMASWIRGIILEYPGLLYDPLYAATRLGIQVDDFSHEAIEELFAEARYTGVFQPWQGRWWKRRLLSIAQNLVQEHDAPGPLNHSFRLAANARYALSLEPPTCVWDGEPVADAVCYILKEPVKVRNSIRYYPDDRPPVMDEARVSFRAIRESNEFDENLVDEDGRSIVNKLWEDRRG